MLFIIVLFDRALNSRSELGQGATFPFISQLVVYSLLTLKLLSSTLRAISTGYGATSRIA